MTPQAQKRSRFVAGMAIFGILFGLLTIVSGGAALFNARAQQMAGNTIGFVLWFNFLAGSAYVIAGAGLLASQRWAVWLSMAIAAATVLRDSNPRMRTSRGGAMEGDLLQAGGRTRRVPVGTSSGRQHRENQGRVVTYVRRGLQSGAQEAFPASSALSAKSARARFDRGETARVRFLRRCTTNWPTAS